ncbi:ABC transporter ATP-binding protein [Dactylosporangium vinaceum]|uniref:ABC transporter ATP-binding protein n=1 Tax=Dactylosporangium vinaceum TaxID=53362 RepID=A0ABV5M312_9ACTN|nr:ABC transporter ATP-binding protein [Dactylosporangium vinaceum]UAB99811.1 ABC transporter ATP-binding protein [Dactylosporangium vinaceum]
MSTPLLSARGLSRDYRLPGGALKHALADVDLDVAAGEILAVIGESGSGKSTLARLLLDLDRPTRGRVEFQGRPISTDRRALRAGTGIVLQDPYASLDPRMRVRTTVAEPLRALRVPGDHRRLVAEVLERVGLRPEHAECYPHELSGGQRQRVAIARAVVHRPRLLVGDEPTSALDVTVRAAIVALLRELNATLGLAVVLVSHDLGLVQHLAARVVVMHDGRIVESGPTASVLADPQHTHTRALVAAVPRLPARSTDAAAL